MPLRYRSPSVGNIRIIVPYVLYRLFVAKDRKGLWGSSYGGVQAYCIAGDLLPKSPLLGLADELISELEAYKKESLKRLS